MHYKDETDGLESERRNPGINSKFYWQNFRVFGGTRKVMNSTYIQIRNNSN